MKTAILFDEIKEGNIVIDDDADIGTVVKADDIHNVQVTFKGGTGNGLYCLDPKCKEYSPLYSYP